MLVRMVPMRSIRTLLLIFSVLILSGILAFGACQRKERRPSRYLIPEGYVGWIRIDFKVKDAPALAIEDNHYLFIIPASGHLETSSDLEYGWSSKDDFY